MIYLHNQQQIFIHITKTGGESVLEALKAKGKRHTPVSVILDQQEQKRYTDILNLFKSENFVPENYLIKIRSNWHKPKFAFVRNPYARVVSDYTYNVKKGIEDKSFEERVRIIAEGDCDLWKWSQVRWLSYKNIIHADKIYKLESDIKVFENDFDVEFPHINQSSTKSYQEFYNDKTRRFVELVYADDFREFSYEF